MVLLLIVLTADWFSGQTLFSGTRTENEHSNTGYRSVQYDTVLWEWVQVGTV